MALDDLEFLLSRAQGALDEWASLRGSAIEDLQDTVREVLSGFELVPALIADGDASRLGLTKEPRLAHQLTTTVPLLFEATRDPDASVRANAIAALA
jgi:hypothetical protein